MSLTLVNSGTLTPSGIGVNTTVDTESPASVPLDYVFEVNTGAMGSGDQALLTVAKGNAPTPGAALLGQVTSLTPMSVSLPVALPAGSPLLVLETGPGAPTTPSDSAGSTYALIADVANANYGAWLANPSFALHQSDWLAAASLPAGTTVKAPEDGASYSVTLTALALSGLAPDPAAYGVAQSNGSSATPSVSTSVSVNAGDLVIAGVTSGTSGTQATGWTSLAGASGSGFTWLSWLVPGASGTVTYAPTLGASASWYAFIFAIPAAGYETVAQLGVNGNQIARKQSHPIPVNTGESVSFRIMQSAGSVRSFPWMVWHL